MDLVRAFQSHMMNSGFSPATVQSYVGDVTLFNDYVNGHGLDGVLNRQSFMLYRQHMQNVGYAVATFNKKVNSLQSYNQFLMESGVMNELVVSLKKERIKVAMGSEPEVDVFTKAETTAILTYIGNPTKCSLRNRVIVSLLLYTGLRVSETCSIRISDIDRVGGSLRVIGKGGKYREIPLRAELVDLLNLYIVTDRKESRFPNSDYLLVSQRAPKMHRDAVRRMLGELGKELRIEIYPHKFRHTFATRLLEKGVPLTTVSKLCGHAGIDTTSRFYVSTSKQQKIDAVNLL